VTRGFVPPVAEGLALRLRPVQPEDAGYIHALRVNPSYNRHLSPVTGRVENQRAWIERYQVREAAGQEIYHITPLKRGRSPLFLLARSSHPFGGLMWIYKKKLTNYSKNEGDW